jgi:hypothetical protein
MIIRSALLFTLLCAAAPAAAAGLGEVTCDDSARLESRLAQVMGAAKQGEGLRGPDAILQVWIVPRSGDWTLVQSYANGTSCIVAMGEHWETLGPRDPA